MRAHRSTHMRSQEQAKSTLTCQKSHFVWKFTGKKAQAQVTGAILWLPGTTFWMEVEAHFRRAILYRNLQEKCRTWIPGTAFCGHVTRAILYGNLQEKCRIPFSRPAFCVEIYRKKRAWTLHKGHFVWKFKGKMRGAPVPTWAYTGPFLLLP